MLNKKKEAWLERQFYFLKDRYKGVCPKCNQSKKLIQGIGKCLECFIQDKAYDAIDKSEIDKPYVKPLLNSDRVEEDDITSSTIASLWEDGKADYFRAMLAAEAKNDT